jgi:hypothetical protein
VDKRSASTDSCTDYQTNVHIANTSDSYKIAKIRFLESRNSHDVLNFNIYMSPYDVWTGIVRNNVGGHANIISNDKTCTMPMYDQPTSSGTLSVDGINMKTTYSDVNTADTHEDYIEVIEIGNISEELVTDMNSSGDVDPLNDTYVWDGLKHGDNRVPNNCDVVTMGWATGAGVGTFGGSDNTASPDNWKGNASPSDDSNGRGGYADKNATFSYNDAAAGNEHLLPPNGGLYGHVIYLNLRDGSTLVNEAIAIDNHTDEAQHWLPNDTDHFLLPSLASGLINTSVEENTGAAGELTTSEAFGYTVDAIMNDGNDQTPASGTNPWPLSHALMSGGLYNDFFVDPIYDGATAWVITFPMRKHGVYKGEFTDDCSGDGTLTPGSVELTTSTVEGTDTCFLNQDKHIVYNQVAYDREEFIPHGPDIFELATVIQDPITYTFLTHAVNVLQLATVSMLGSENAEINTGPSESGNAGVMSIWFGGGITTYTTNDASLFTSQDAGNNASFIAQDVSSLEYNDLTFVPPGLAEDATGSLVVTGIPAIGFAAQRGSASSLPAGSSFSEIINHRPIRG